MISHKLHFIVIDDSKLDCFIAEKVIRNTGMSESTRSFLDAREALAYITADAPVNSKTILIVDIHMPLMNGFEFVEAFEKLPSQVQDKYIIYILSSSINENDLSRVKNYPVIRHFLSKPLTSNTLSALLEHL